MFTTFSKVDFTFTDMVEGDVAMIDLRDMFAEVTGWPVQGNLSLDQAVTSLVEAGASTELRRIAAGISRLHLGYGGNVVLRTSLIEELGHGAKRIVLSVQASGQGQCSDRSVEVEGEISLRLTTGGYLRLEGDPVADEPEEGSGTLSYLLIRTGKDDDHQSSYSLSFFGDGQRHADPVSEAEEAYQAFCAIVVKDILDAAAKRAQVSYLLS